MLIRRFRASTSLPLVLALCCMPFTGRAAPHADGALFDTHLVYGSTAAQPTSIAAGDLDGDGLDDVVVTHRSSTISVLLGIGEGVLGPATRFTVFDPSYPLSIKRASLADVDGDGAVDVVASVTNGDTYLNGYALVVHGNGDGTLDEGTLVQYRQRGEFGTGPEHVIAADVNGDGRLDLVTANGWYDELSILIQRSDGQFVVQPYVTGGDWPTEVVAEDFDGDGHLDLAALNRDGNDVTLHRGHGTGAFDPPIVLDGHLGPRQLLVNDFDGDGESDLATSRYTAGQVEVSLGRGDGSFDPSALYVSGAGSGELAVGDLDGDGLFDVVTADAGGELGLLSGVGLGSFDANGIVATGWAVRSLVLADMNGDGRSDPLSLAGGHSTAGIHVQPTGDDGIPRAAYRSEIGGALLETGPMATADFDGDGHLDVVVVTSARNHLRVLRGDGGGDFAPSDPVESGYQINALLVSDLDGDGVPDVVASQGWGVKVHLGLGDGGLGPAIVVDDHTRTGAIALEDLDGDGARDLVTQPQYSDELLVYRGNGDGTFEAPDAWLADGGARVLVGDLDGDDAPDLLGSDVWLRGLGDGTFEPALAIPADDVLALADFDQDQALDVLDRTGVRRGRGNGTFDDPIAMPSGAPSFCHAPAVSDFDGDGIPDLLCTNAYLGFLFLQGNGDGSFQPPQSFSYGMPGESSTRVIADVDGNSVPDVLIASGRTNGIWVAWNRVDPPLRPGLDILTRGQRKPFPLPGRGLIMVALLGSDDFDVEEVEEASLRFGPGNAEPTERPRSRRRDANRDGFDDLVLHFRTDEAALADGETRACLSGKLESARRFEACDADVTPGPCGKGHGLVMLVPAIVWIGRGARRGRRAI